MIEALLMSGGAGVKVKQAFSLGVFEAGDNSLTQESINLPYTVDPASSFIYGQIHKTPGGYANQIFTPSFNDQGTQLVLNRYSADAQYDFERKNTFSLTIVELSGAPDLFSGTAVAAGPAVTIDLSGIISDRSRCLPFVFARRNVTNDNAFLYHYYIDQNNNLVVDYGGSSDAEMTVEWSVLQA